MKGEQRMKGQQMKETNMKTTAELNKMKKEELVNTIAELQSTLIILGKNNAEYKEALTNARTLLAERRKQIEKSSRIFEENQALKDEILALTHTKREPIEVFLKESKLNGYALNNYFRDLFIEYQYKYTRNRIKFTKLETQLLFQILWKYQNNRSEVSVYNTDFTPDKDGRYEIAFSVDTSLLSNGQIRHYNNELGTNIPENQLTAEEKEQLQTQDREVLVIER